MKADNNSWYLLYCMDEKSYLQSTGMYGCNTPFDSKNNQVRGISEEEPKTQPRNE